MEINQELIDTITELGSVWGLRVVGAIGLLIVGRVVCGTLRRATRRTLEKSSVDASLVTGSSAPLMRHRNELSSSAA